MSDRRAFLTTIGAIGFGGCLRFSTDGETVTQSPTPRPPTGTEGAVTTGTATPAPTADGTPTATPEATFPDGLSEEGVSSFLFSTHQQTLSRRSFRAAWTKVNRSASVMKWQKEYHVESGQSLGRWTRESGAPVEMYRYPLGDYWREDLGPRYTYGQDESANQGHPPETWGIELEPLIRAVDWSAPTRVEEDRPAVWAVSAETVADRSAIPGYHIGEIIAIESGRLRVDEHGVIQRVEAAYRIRKADGTELDYEIQYAIDQINQVTVTEPDWLSTARDRVPELDARRTDDDRAIRIELVSGNQLEPRTRLFADEEETANTGFGVTLAEPVTAGEPVFLYQPADAPAEGFVDGGITRGSPPDADAAQDLTTRYGVMARREATQYFTRSVGV